MIRWSAMLCCLAAAVCAQVARDPNARFDVTGSVLDADSGMPIGRARVTVREQLQNGVPGVPREFVLLTDAGGGFQLRSLPEGSFGLEASKAEYIDPRMPSRAKQTSIFLNGASNRKTETKLYLRQQAALEGTVLGQNSRGEQGSVQIFRTSVSSGHYRLEQAGQGQVQPDGTFRIAGLLPGRYFAAFVPNGSSAHGGALVSALTLYPGVSDVRSALPLQVVSGTTTDIHLRPLQQAVYEYRGVLPAWGGNGFQLQAVEGSELPIYPFFLTQWNGNTGELRIGGAPPGQYLFSAGNTQQRALITIGNADARDQQPVLLGSQGISGQIRVDGPMPDGARLNTYVQFQNARQNMGSGSLTQDNHFTAQLPPGSYRMTIPPSPPLHVKSARQGGRDLLRDDLVVGVGGADPIEIVMAVGTARLTYKLGAESKDLVQVTFLRKSGRDYEVAFQNMLMNPIPDAMENPMLRRPMPTQGEIAQAPAGEYLVLAWPQSLGNIESLPYNEAAFLEKYRRFGQSLTVYEGDSLTLSIEKLLPKEAFDLP